MKVRAYNSKGKVVKCSTCGSKETAGAIMGVDSSLVYCSEHSPYKDVSWEDIIITPEIQKNIDELKARNEFLSKDSWTADLREKK